MSPFLLPKERLEELENKVGLTPEEAQELFAHIGELEGRLTIAPGPFLFEFTSFDHWADTAQIQFREAGHSSANVIGLDANGRTCYRGKDFMQAQAEGTFPVRFYSLIR